MGLVVGIGKGKDKSSRLAAKQAVEACQFQLGANQPDLLVLFINPFYNSQEVLGAIRDFYPKIPLLGCSTSGEIYTSGIDDKTIGLLGISGLDVKMAMGSNVGENALEVGETLGEKLGGELGKLVLLFADVLAGDGEAAVRGMQTGLGEQIPIIGGAAGDDVRFSQTFQYCNDEAVSESLVGAKLSGSFKFGIGVHHGWEPVGLPVKATRTRGNHLLEVNELPAVKLYEEYFGEFTKRLREEPLGRLAVYYPLGIAVPDSDGYLLRAPLFVEQDGAIKLTAEIPENTDVRLMIGSVEEAMKAARQAAKDALAQMKNTKPKVALVFNCVARRRLLGLKANDEIQAIREIIGKNVPVIGFYSYGEIAPVQNDVGIQNRFHNETVVILTMG